MWVTIKKKEKRKTAAIDFKKKVKTNYFNSINSIDLRFFFIVIRSTFDNYFARDDNEHKITK